MTLARAVHPLVPALLLAGAAASAGCPAGTPVTVPSGAPSARTEVSVSSGKGSEDRVSKNRVFQIIDGSIAGPAALAGGEDRIRGIKLDQLEAGLANQAPAFRVAQAVAVAEKPISNALISIRGYDLRTIPELASLYSDESGTFYFTNVPSQIAFFLEANVETEDKAFQLLGLTRTEDVGKVTKVKIDVASTLVARELMRMWQISGYRVSFKDLDPRDFNPLLQRLRKHLAGGLPAGVSFDPTTVTTPTGDWSLEADRKDSAVLALDKIAAQHEPISREIDRLYLAVNYTITRVRDASRVVIPRPPSLSAVATPAPTQTTTPVDAPTPSPTPRPTKLFTVTGRVSGATAKVTLRFAPDLERDEDGRPATAETDDSGAYTAQLAVGAEDGAAIYEVFVVGADGTETSRGSIRVFEDGQVLPDVDAPPSPV